MSPPVSHRLRLRDAVIGDLDALVSIENHGFRTDRLKRRQFLYHLRRAANRLLVAEEADTVAGYLLLLQRGTLARIYSLAVDKAWRGRGLGEALCLRAEDIARANGASRIRLEVRETNRAARGLYAKLGYREFERLPGYYADGSDGWRLEKSLR